jgi:hypothetical protein
MNVANIKARTVTAVVAYDDPVSGETILLIINQAIYIPTLEHNLLCPMQMRLKDVLVSEIPKFLSSSQPQVYTHTTLRVREVKTRDQYLIPLSLEGVTSYFPTRKPNVVDYESETNSKYELTFESPEWDPHLTQFAEQEAAFTDSSGQLREPGDKTGMRNFFVSSVSRNPLTGDQSDGFLNALCMNALFDRNANSWLRKERLLHAEQCKHTRETLGSTSAYHK